MKSCLWIFLCLIASLNGEKFAQWYSLDLISSVFSKEPLLVLECPDSLNSSIDLLKGKSLLIKGKVGPFTPLLEHSNFRLVASWEEESLFVRGEFFDDFASSKALDDAWMEIRKNYQRYYVYFPGAIFYLDEGSDSIKSILKQGDAWEGNIGLLIKKYCKEGTVVVDVGAHIGLHTINMSRKVGPKGAVIAFEPQRKLYLEQLQNLKFNNCKNVISICKAIGEKKEMVQLTPVDLENEGGTAIGEGGEWTAMIPLDSLHLTNVSLIKLDVENYEYFTLLGAKETIIRNHPVIIFEINGSNLDPNPEKEKENLERITDLIHSLGYKIYQLHNKDYIAVPADFVLDFDPTKIKEGKDYLLNTLK